MMKTEIPIQNIYYLLAYAWNHFRTADELNVSSSQCPEVHNLLAMLLSGGIRRLATKGMDIAVLIRLRLSLKHSTSCGVTT